MPNFVATASKDPRKLLPPSARPPTRTIRLMAILALNAIVSCQVAVASRAGHTAEWVAPCSHSVGKGASSLSLARKLARAHRGKNWSPWVRDAHLLVRAAVTPETAGATTPMQSPAAVTPETAGATIPMQSPAITARTSTRKEVATGVWTFDHAGTRMTVIRLDDGSLWVHSPVRLTAGTAAELAELGPVAHIVIPNTFPEHGFFARQFTRAYPDARVYATVPKEKLLFVVKWGLPRVDLVLGNKPPPAWAGTIDQMLVSLDGGFSDSLFCHRPTGALLCADLFWYADDEFARGPLLRWNLRRLGFYKEVGSIAMALLKSKKNRSRVQELADKLGTWEFDTLIFGHMSAPVPHGKHEMQRVLEKILQGDNSGSQEPSEAGTGLQSPAPALQTALEAARESLG